VTASVRRQIGPLLRPLGERAFRLQFAAQATSVVGDYMVPVALAFAVFSIDSSPSALGVVLAAYSASLVVFVPIGGVWADRLPRNRVMVVADLARFAAQGAAAGLLLAGVAEVWMLAALQVVVGAGTALFRPAVTGLTPQTVSAERLQQANALLSLTASLAGIAGPTIAGVIVATVGPGWALAADSATFVVSAAFLLRIGPLPPTAERRQRFLRELADGWREVRARTWVWVSIAGFMAFQLCVLSTVFVLGPVVANRSLGGAGDWAIVAAALGVGSLIGDLLALRFEPSRPLVASRLATVAVAPLLVLLGFESPVLVLAIAAVAAGMAFTFPDTLWYTALQENVPPASLSRVSSYDWMGSSALRPLGYALVGPVAAGIGIRATFILAASIIVCLELSTLAVPSVRALRAGRARARRLGAPETEPWTQEVGPPAQVRD
jgi:MFS family permease